jgi:hypothetical protein
MTKKRNGKSSSHSPPSSPKSKPSPSQQHETTIDEIDNEHDQEEQKMISKIK